MPLVLTLLLGGVALGGWMLWKRLGPQILTGPDYTVTAEKIEVNTPPPWITCDLVGEAALNGSLDGLNITEPRLTVMVADAFALHPWVEEVVRVHKKAGAHVQVELVYRKPVGMVEVQIDDEPGLLPVDRNGVLLPPEDFDPEIAGRYPRLNVGRSMPAGPVGTPWGDAKLAGAATLANLLGEHWEQLGLYRIVVEDNAHESALRSAPRYSIETTSGTRIVWGHAPGEETSSEANAETKLARLLRHAESGSGLAAEEPQQIDLTDARSAEISPRAASVPMAPPE